MRQDKMLIPTLREAPAEAEAVSHRLLLRAGFIRQVAAGVYTYLPLGWRVLNKIADIVSDEMDRVDAQQVLLPAMQPAELWRESGRYSAYGPELIRLQDRHQREFALGPTHEEIVTALIRSEVFSYRKLPLVLYQVQTKFRDERRPRFGLLRGREFLMKDAYSFHADGESLDQTYKSMFEAYSRIFARCGLNVRPVEADAGTIGGEGGTHEFMALADIGEDTVVSCTRCDYAANLEKAEAGAPDVRVEVASGGRTGAMRENADAGAAPVERLHTPSVRTIKELAAFMGTDASRIVKTLIYVADGKPVAVLIRGDREANEVKLAAALGESAFELADASVTQDVTGAPVGFAGPVGLAIPIVADREVAAMDSFVAGANEKDFHLCHVVPGRDFTIGIVGDFRNVAENDSCPRCSGALQFRRGIEVGQVFKLGTKYSGKLGAVFTAADGQEQALLMGCYGIGISRLLSAIVEQHHDEGGIVWPAAVAPYGVHLTVVSMKDREQTELAEVLYRRLKEAGVEVLLDDRDERPGVKFKDADLIGIPVRITIGRGAGERVVEYKERGGAETALLEAETALARVLELLAP